MNEPIHSLFSLPEPKEGSKDAKTKILVPQEQEYVDQEKLSKPEETKDVRYTDDVKLFLLG